MVLAAVVVGMTGTAAFGAESHTALTHNPCEFLDPGNPGTVIGHDTLFGAVIGTYQSAGAVTVVSDLATGPDYQDGVCNVDGGLTSSAPASDCGGASPCSPLFGEYEFWTFPEDQMSSALQTTHTDQFYPSQRRRHISGAGPNGTEACTSYVILGGCVAWFTKGTKFVLIEGINLEPRKSTVAEGKTYPNLSYEMNGSGPTNTRKTVETVADIAYDHMSTWSTADRPNGAP